jgi:bifunctional DNase/RNase
VKLKVNRRLPIIIGMFEAQADCDRDRKDHSEQTDDHDLFKALQTIFISLLRRIIISDLKEGVFFRKDRCSDGLKKSENRRAAYRMLSR